MCIVAFGIEASLPLGLILLADTIVLLSFTSFFISLSERTSTYNEIVKNLIKRIVSQPLLIAVCLGMFFSLLNIKPINTLDKFIEMIASAAAPVALIALGASIKFNFQKNENLELVMISLGKLIIHPFLLILIFLIWPSEKIFGSKQQYYVLVSQLPQMCLFLLNTMVIFKNKVLMPLFYQQLFQHLLYQLLFI